MKGIIINDAYTIKGNEHPLYIIDGDEYYFKKMTVDKIRDHFLPAGQTPFNFQKINPDNYEDKRTFETHLLQAGLFSKRVILIDNFDSFSETAKKEILEILKKDKWISDLDTVVVVLTYSKLDMDPKRKWLADLNILASKDFCCYMISFPLFRNKLSEWIRNYFREMGKVISNDLIEMLIEAGDGTINSVKVEIDKLCCYIGEKTKIDIEDINESLGDFKIVPIFDFCNYSLLGDKVKALKALSRIIECSDSHWHLQVLKLIWWTYRRNLSIFNSYRNNENPENIKKKIHGQLETKKMIFERIIKCNKSIFNKQQELIYKLEKTIKKGSVSSKLAFERFIIELPLIIH